MLSAKVAYSTTLDYVKHRDEVELEKISDLIDKTMAEGEFGVIVETLSPSVEKILREEGYFISLRRYTMGSSSVLISWDFAHEEV